MQQSRYFSHQAPDLEFILPMPATITITTIATGILYIHYNGFNIHFLAMFIEC